MKIINTIGHIFSGFYNLIMFKLSKKYREKQLLLFKKKLDICEACPFFNPRARQCEECGCFVDAKTKATYEYDSEGYAISYRDRKTKEVYYACPKKFW